VNEELQVQLDLEEKPDWLAQEEHQDLPVHGDPMDFQDQQEKTA